MSLSNAKYGDFRGRYLVILDSFFFFGLVSFSQLLITLLCNMWKTELSWLRFFYVKSGLLFQKSLFWYGAFPMFLWAHLLGQSRMHIICWWGLVSHGDGYYSMVKLKAFVCLCVCLLACRAVMLAVGSAGAFINKARQYRSLFNTPLFNMEVSQEQSWAETFFI